MSDIIIKNISPKELNKDSLILDVRSDDEIKEKSLDLPFIHEFAEKINVKDFIKKHKLDGKKTLNILCKSGIRATDTAKKFIKEGYDNVKVITGGIIQAEKDGLKMRKQEKNNKE